MASREVKTAVEVPGGRRYSRVGTVQRHYHLTPALAAENGAPIDNVVVAPGWGCTYVFPADRCGAVADYRKIASVPGVDDPVTALEALGYIATSDASEVAQGKP